MRDGLVMDKGAACLPSSRFLGEGSSVCKRISKVWVRRQCDGAFRWPKWALLRSEAVWEGAQRTSKVAGRFYSLLKANRPSTDGHRLTNESEFRLEWVATGRSPLGLRGVHTSTRAARSFLV